LASKIPTGAYDWALLASRAFGLLYAPDPDALLEQRVIDTRRIQLGPTASEHEMMAGVAGWEEAWILALKEAARWQRNMYYHTDLGALIAILQR
jgi:hypothetical protein